MFVWERCIENGHNLGTRISYERIYSHQKRMGYQPEQGPEGNFLVEFVCGGSLHDSLSGDDGNCIIVFFFFRSPASRSGELHHSI